MKKELIILAALVVVFLFLYFNPWVETETLEERDASIAGKTEKKDSTGAVVTVFSILKEYAQNHIITCLVPAFFIAGAIAVFAKKETVLKLLGHATKKYIAYPIASISGAVLAV
jgi:uncharacterized membrane protein YraQ (UPF0718 family)